MPKIPIQEKSLVSFRKILKNKWDHATVLQKRFHLNSHTLEFHTETRILETTSLYSRTNSTTEKYCSVGFHQFECSHLRISSTDSKVRTTLFSIINSTTGKHCSVTLFEWSHFRISSTDLKVRTALYSIITSTTGKHCSVAGHTTRLSPLTQALIPQSGFQSSVESNFRRIALVLHCHAF